MEAFDCGSLKVGFRQRRKKDFRPAMPRWPVRAVGCAHFAPPTHRTRRDGQGHLRSVPPSVAPADATMRPFRLSRRPAAPTAVLFVPDLIRLHIEASDATIRKR